MTIRLHLDGHLDDGECFELTQCAWERCVRALGQGEDIKSLLRPAAAKSRYVRGVRRISDKVVQAPKKGKRPR